MSLFHVVMSESQLYTFPWLHRAYSLHVSVFILYSELVNICVNLREGVWVQHHDWDTNIHNFCKPPCLTLKYCSCISVYPDPPDTQSLWMEWIKTQLFELGLLGDP